MSTIQDLMRNCLKAMEKRNSSEVVDFFADDGVWITPFGKFAGKAEIKKFLDWQNSQMSWTAEGVGNEIIVSGKRAFFEHLIRGKIQNKKVELPAMCAWEFDENDKIKEIRTIYDRFSTLQQAATGIGKILVGIISKQFVVK